MSRSELKLEDGIARLTVRMQVVETEHLPAAARDLARYFRVDGQPPVASKCRIEDGDLVCQGTFFAGAPKIVESDLPDAVLPHHVHTMQAAGVAYTFTPQQTRRDLDGSPAPRALWIGLPVLAIFAVWWIRSLRSRRKIAGPG